MYHFEFTPETADQPANLALVADTKEELKHQTADCIGTAIGGHKDYGFSPEDVKELMQASSDNLPIRSLAKFLGDDTIINTQTGLAVYPTLDESSLADYVLEIDDIERQRLSFEESNAEALGLIFDGLCNSMAWQLQILPKTNGEHEVIEHRSYGKLNAAGEYTPIVTVLSDKHPAMQAQSTNETQA